jgi:PKD repeat protein
VIAMNHNPLDGCYNTGVKMTRIWPEISSHFGGVIPAGDLEDSNQAPAADLGWSCSQMQCNFNASGSSDPDGFIASYHWDTGDGFTTSNVSFSHTYAFNGTYTITLTVVDNDGGAATATSTVTAWGGADPGSNEPPNAAFQVNCNDTDCNFDAAASSDSDGSIQSYQWSFGDGGTDTRTSPTTSHQYSQAGTYSVSLTVVDDDGASGSASSTITVLISTPNVDPTANFTSGCNDLSCNFNGSFSSDSDGTIVSYQWNFGDGGNSTNMAPSHTYSSDGSYNVTLTVYDDAGGSNSMTTTITVSGVQVPPPNASPTADFTFSCNDLSCTFDGSLSSDSDGDVMSHQWSFGDGSSGTGMNKSHAFNNGGTYQVTLTVWDDQDASDSRSRSVTVSPPPNAPPTASFSFSCNELTCNFNGSSSGDSDGTIASYSWSFGGSGSTSSHTFGSSGTYSVSLTVTDDKGASDSQTRSVQATAPLPPPNDITLSVSGSKYRGRKEAELSWGGITTGQVQIIRDGSIIATTVDDGSYIDKTVAKKTKRAQYQVCESDGIACSEVVDTRF